MNHEENSFDDKIGSMRSKKQALLNKFLSKTYHMIDQCDPSIVTWSSDGDTFAIKDVDEFAKTVLPRYFKHSKFASFVRQLNFYSFRKLRSDPDVRVSSKSVRFAHDYFRKGQPELLHRIQRITKSQDECSVEIKSVKDEIATMNEQLQHFSSRLDHTLKSLTFAVESDYQQRMTKIAVSYEALSNLATRFSSNSPPCTPSMTKSEISFPESPRSTMSPLMTLSGVAAMISDRSDYLLA